MSPPNPRDMAVSIARQLHEAGHIGWFAGGCVRDELLGLTPKDYDIATDATPGQVSALFPNALSVGASFGVMLLRRHGISVEIATFREEGAYSDHRRPDTIQFSDASHDASRRDFTINGMFRDPLTDDIHDFVGGQADLKAKLIRCIGDPAHRFQEDHLRMLRAIRFVSSLHFDLEPSTEAAIATHATELQGVSRERIGGEIELILAASGRIRAISLLESLGLGATCLGSQASSNTWPRLESCHNHNVSHPILLAAWCLDRMGGDVEIEEDVAKYRSHLLISNDCQRVMSSCLACHAAYLAWDEMSIASKKRLAAREASTEALLLLNGRHQPLATRIQKEISTWTACEIAPQRLLSGHDLLQAGFPAGRLLGRALERVYDAQLEGRIRTYDEAITLARTIHCSDLSTEDST